MFGDNRVIMYEIIYVLSGIKKNMQTTTWIIITQHCITIIQQIIYLWDSCTWDSCTWQKMFLIDWNRT